MRQIEPVVTRTREELLQQGQVPAMNGERAALAGQGEPDLPADEAGSPDDEDASVGVLGCWTHLFVDASGRPFPVSTTPGLSRGALSRTFS
jgi:hypothetical protein